MASYWFLLPGKFLYITSFNLLLNTKLHKNSYNKQTYLVLKVIPSIVEFGPEKMGFLANKLTKQG